MHSARSDASVRDTVEVTLVGGPLEAPERARVPLTTVRERKVKVPRHGGYEHYELVDAKDGASDTVFEWTMRTTIAE
ncbi:DUF5988 family protein [Actinomadura sp. NEAU-AAG7]|uniref:DUF5988 family protein n=1 Tax=Actinomadura sp. NEAU-AAG7 TaxID=2839640 RepID=UPI001BE401B4|nr:DUF5988 family protein [Actinomadura sp. NEAU-AAG7]MBT2212489.1 hypothetical protein [Actinomadura sp. NEAU-AAG7]